MIVLHALFYNYAIKHQDYMHRRGSELTREVLEAAGLAPEHDAEPRDMGAGEVFHEPVVLNPGGGGLRSALRGN